MSCSNALRRSRATRAIRRPKRISARACAGRRTRSTRWCRRVLVQDEALEAANDRIQDSSSNSASAAAAGAAAARLPRFHARLVFGRDEQRGSVPRVPQGGAPAGGVRPVGPAARLPPQPAIRSSRAIRPAIRRRADAAAGRGGGGSFLGTAAAAAAGDDRRRAADGRYPLGDGGPSAAAGRIEGIRAMSAAASGHSGGQRGERRSRARGRSR